MTTPKAGLKTMPTGILKNEQVFNEGIILLEALTYRGVISRAVLDPAGISPSPTNGDIYLINDGSPTSTGDWSGQGGKMAVYFNGWRFLPPDEGLTLWIIDETQIVQYRSGVWVDVNEFPAQTLTELTDVDLSGSPSPQDGDLFRFDAAIGKWTARSPSHAELSLLSVSHTSGDRIVMTWAEVEDTDNYFDSGSSTANIIAPFTGRYRLTCNLSWVSANASWSAQVVVRLERTGTTSHDDFPGLRVDNTQPLLDIRRHERFTGIIRLTAGQTIDILAFQFSATRNTDTGGRLWIEYLGQ